MSVGNQADAERSCFLGLACPICGSGWISPSRWALPHLYLSTTKQPQKIELKSCSVGCSSWTHTSEMGSSTQPQPGPL